MMSHRGSQGFHRRLCVAKHRMALADQLFRRQGAVVQAFAGPEQRHRLRSRGGKCGQRADIGSRREGQHRQHHVDIRVIMQNPAHLGENIRSADRGGGQVGRVGRLAEAWQQCTQGLLRRSSIRRPLDPEAGAEIGDHHQVATGNRGSSGAPPANRPAPPQQHRGFVQLVAVVDPHDTELFERRAADIVSPGHRTGMRCRRPAAGRRAAYLDHHNRLVKRGSARGQRAQPGAIRDRLGQRQHHPGALVFHHEGHVVEQVEVGVIAATDLIADLDAGLLRAPHHIDLAGAARMAGHRHLARRSARAADHRGGGHRHAVDEVDHAVAIRAHDAHAPSASRCRDLCLQRAPFGVAGLGETGGKHGCERHAGTPALLECLGNRGCRQYDAHVVRHGRQVGQRRVARQPEDFLAFRIDRINRAGKPEVDQFAYAAAAEFGEIFSRPDVGDADRREKAPQIGKRRFDSRW